MAETAPETVSVPVRGKPFGGAEHEVFCDRLDEIGGHLASHADLLWRAMWEALDRHQPRNWFWFLRGGCRGCQHRWPCPEYLAIRDVILREGRTGG